MSAECVTTCLHACISKMYIAYSIYLYIHVIICIHWCQCKHKHIILTYPSPRFSHVGLSHARTGQSQNEETVDLTSGKSCGNLKCHGRNDVRYSHMQWSIRKSTSLTPYWPFQSMSFLWFHWIWFQETTLDNKWWNKPLFILGGIRCPTAISYIA